MRLVPKFLAATVVAALLAGPAMAELQFTNVDASHASPMFDVLVMRPVGLIALGFGALLWLPAAAITAAVQPSELGKPTETLVLKPYHYVFDDPIGSH